MGLLSSLFGGRHPTPTVAHVPPRVSARFDAADSTDDARHWANADYFSLDGALTPVKRRTMRNRARYERLNNSYLAGICETVANETIGTGPRLQLDTGDQAADRVIERQFFDWSWRIDFAGKLRTMRQSKMIDGEAFAQFVTNPRLDGVQLDLRLVEAEMVTTPIGIMLPNTTPEGSLVDGLEFDDAGNVIAYKVLKTHPGSNFRVDFFAFNRVPAENMVHWFTQQRPAQNRGVSEVAPALRLFANMRRYTEAVIAAAETAADFAAFIHSTSPAAAVDEVTPFESMEIEKRSLVTLPEGWSVSQLRSEQPTSTYAMFKREILNEIARCLQLPYNVAALDSSSYNYASGRMDHAVWAKTRNVVRDELERLLLDRVLVAWLDEAALLGIIPANLPPVVEWNWSWVWDGNEHVDPSKEASAAETRLRTNTTTLAHEYSKQGKNWETELRQRAAELNLARELGLPTTFAPDGSPAAVAQDSGGDA